MSMEDYLQEFGRAGRDGKPSVAVLFTSRKDEGLLQFMAERTAASTKADPIARDQALRAKYDSIREMHEHACSRNGCFRSAIIQYFGGEQQRTRRPLSLRILDWLFSTSPRVTPARHCCDVCDGVQTRSVVAWAAEVLRESPSRRPRFLHS
jgi:ATP-dependent DNA helicase RecQ